MSSSSLSTVPSTHSAPPTEQRGRASIRTPPNAGRSMSEDSYETPRAICCDMAPLFAEGQTAKRPFFEKKNAHIVFVPATLIPLKNENVDNPFAQARGAVPQHFAAAAGLGSNNNNNELHIADGVHSMTNTDESDYESVADWEQGSPIPCIATRIRTRRPTPATQSASDNRTLRKILTTIRRLETRMDGMEAQIRTTQGPIGLGDHGPVWRTDTPTNTIRQEIDEMAMKVATMSHTLKTEIGKVQLQEKEYHDNSEMLRSTTFVTAIAEEVAKALIAKDTTKGKGRATIEPALPKPNRRTQVQPPPPPPPSAPSGSHTVDVT